jgi:hypothetical protein
MRFPADICGVASITEFIATVISVIEVKKPRTKKDIKKEECFRLPASFSTELIIKPAPIQIPKKARIKIKNS